MAIELSVRAEALIQQIGINPQMILDIEGVDIIFGASLVLKVLEWDDESPLALWDNDLLWDGSIADSKARDWISLSDTTTNITQQIAPDKSSTSSIGTVNISIIDKNGEVSKLLAFDKITDILGRKATFSIGFAQGNYPEDANPVFRGVVVDFYTDAGKVMISLASPETIKRQLFLEKFQSSITASMNNSQTSMDLISTIGIYPELDALKTYLRIDDEIVRVTSINSDTNLTIQRAQLNTVANAHDIEAEVETFYTLSGKPLDIALKIMLSSEGNQYFESLDVPKSINFVSVIESISNAIIFDYFSIQEKTGLTVGDFVQLDSGLNTGTYTISEFGVLESGDSYIVVNETLVEEPEYIGSFRYLSKYNVLSTGLGMLTSEVDVEQFENITAQFGSNFVDYEIYIKDSIDNAKTFIDEQVFFPQGLYSIPRKARSSVKFIAPPFSSDIVPYLDINSVTNASKIRQRRSIHKYHYNTYVYRYNVDSLEDNYLTGKVIVSADSLNRIPVGKKQLRIESDGFRNNPPTTNIINNLALRLIDRYQFAPAYFDDIEVNYKTGYSIEVGDIVPFGGQDLKVTNLKSGAPGTDFALYEVINKSLNVKDGKVKLSLVSTSFDINARYAVVGPSSVIGEGSTLSRIRINTFNDLDEYARESDKWLTYSGQIISISSKDYTYCEEVVLAGVDPTDNNFLLLETNLTDPPLEGYFVEPSNYRDENDEVNGRFKLEVGHFNSLVEIINVIDDMTFDVDAPEKLAVGSSIYLNSQGYTRDSFGKIYTIASIVGNQVTLNVSLDFTPLVGDFINNSNYLDDGFPYVLI